MRAVLRSLVVSVLCGVGALACVLAGALGGGSSSASTLAGGGSSAPTLGGALVITGSPLEGEQRQAQRQAFLSNPQEVAERAASRTAFAGANERQARRVALEAFPEVVNRPGGTVQLPAGQRIGHYLSATAAQVTLPTGQRGAIESLQPIAKKTGRHRYVPLDLSLRTTGNGYAPARAVVAVEIPARLSAGVSTPGNDVSLTPVSLQSGKLGGAQGRQEGASVIYVNTQADTDTLVKPTPSGFDMDAILRSANSPQELDYKVGMPAGARLAKTPASEAIQVVKAGETIATILAPNAQDAEGTSVPASMRIHGNVISVAVAHRSGSYRYPIEVDPEVTDKQLATTNTGKRSNWGFKSSPETSFTGSKVYESAEKEYLETKAIKEYKAGDIAYWGYETQGESKIFEIKTKTRAENNSAKIESFLEFQAAAGTKETRTEPPLSDEVEKTTEYSEKPATLCAYNAAKKLEECLAAAGGNKNRVHFQQSATGTGSSFKDWLLEGVVSISEAAGMHATAEFNKSSPEIAVEVEEGGKKVVKNRVNALYGSGIWLSKNQGALELIGKDKGIGVSKTVLEYESSPGKWEPISHSAEHEYLEKENGCQGIQCEPEHKEWWLLESKLPNGEDKIRYRAEDAMSGTESPASEDEVGVKVDTEKPHGLFIEGLPAANELSERSYELTAEATDGEGSTVAASGIKSLKLYIENSHGENKEITKTGGAGECMAAKGECTATATYTLSGTELGAGHHQITIVAIDRAGNEQREYEPISIHHSTPVALGPGSVDLQSGDFTLGATDVSIGSGLSVSRNYSSRDLTQGEEGPLGAPWSMSLGTSESLVEMVDGSMLLTDSNGAQTVFALVAPKTEPPTYEAPIGDSNLKLTVEENKTTKEKLAYYLEDPALHTKDKFTLPSGDTTTWVPTIQEGALTGTTTASYTYEVLEPEAGKKLLVAHEELAPHPGTSCSPMKAGCQALKFKYATATTAEGENKAQWGNYKDRLEKIYLLTYNPASKEMTKEPGIAVAEYTYDARGRLRAEWNPGVKPGPPMTSYGYDEEGHVTAMTSPGQESWVFAYGTATNDAGTGRLLRATQAPASAGLWGGELAKNSVAPKITGTPVVGGSALTVSAGTWTTGSNEPVTYAYQWEDCNSSGIECVAIPGAINSSYVPHVTDAGHTLVVQVSALNGGGAAVASSTATALISTAVSKEYGIPTRTPVTQVIPGPSSNLWYTSSSTNEIGEMTTAGVVVKDFALPSGSEPYGLTVGSDGNVWFVDSGTSKIGKITTAGVITEYALTAGSKPVGVAEGADKNVWFTEASANKVGKITTSGTVTLYTTASGSEPYEIAAGPTTESSLWFTERGNGKVAKVTTSGTVTEYSAIENAESKPSNITLGPDNDLWVSVNGVGPFPQYQQIFKINPSTGGHSHVLSTDGIVGGITAGSDKNIWYTERETNEEGREDEKEFVNRLTTSGVVTFHKLSEDQGLGSIASGSDGNLWVGNSGIAPKMAKVTTSGTATYYSLNWSTAEHITTGPDGNLWYTDAESSRVGKITTAGVVTEYQLPFGSEPEGITTGPDGNLWFTERKTNKISKITTAGVITEYTDPTSGAEPDNIVAGPDGKLWFTESKFFNGGKTGIANITTSGTVTEYGLPEKSGPSGIAVGSEGKIWFTEYDSGYVGSINTSGGELKEYSVGGSDPEAIVTGPDGDMWVAEVTKQIARVSPTGSVTQFSVSSQPCGITVGPEKSIWFKASSKIGRITVGGVATEYPALGGCRSITFGPDGNLWLGAASSIGKVIMNPTVSPPAGESGLTMEYGVPLEGTGAPAQMGINSTTHMREPAAWGQREEEDPVEGTSIIPPDSPQGWPAASYSRATTYYLDSRGRIVNVATPSTATSGAISTMEYNELNDVIRTLTPRNREIALAAGCESEEKCKSAEESKLLDTENTYNGEGAKEGEVAEPGTQLIETLGPEHMVKYTKGEKQYSPGEKATEVMGRSYTHNYYNEGAPTENPRTHRKETYDLLTQSENFVELPAHEKERTDVKTTIKSYSGQEDLGWLLRKPTSITVNPGSLKLTTTTVYEENAAKESNGEVAEMRSTGSEGTYTYTSKFGEAGTEPGKLKGPFGLAVDSTGHLWTLDENNNRVEEFGPEGKYMTSFGKAGAEPGEFKEAKGLAVEPGGNVWVADAGNNRVEKFGPEGKFLLAVGKAGTGNGELKSPKALAIDKSGDVWVADSSNNRIEEFGPEGKYLSVFGKVGTGNGELKEPKGIAIDAKGNIWVADTANNRIQEFEPNGKLLAHFGSAGTGAGQFKTPFGLAFDPSGNLWVADEGNNRLQELSSSGAFMAQVGWTGKEAGQLTGPRAVAIAAGGEVWTSDFSNNRLEEFSKGLNARDQKIIYYSSAANTEGYASCGEHAEWEGLPCETLPTKQPELDALPKLPVVITKAYSIYDEPETIEEIFKSASGVETKRTKTNTYDEAGRLVTSKTTSTNPEEDKPLGVLTSTYNEAGQLETQSAEVKGEVKTITAKYNTLGQQTEYTDADGAKTVSKYAGPEGDYLLEEVTDGSAEGAGRQTYSYDATTKLMTKLTDFFGKEASEQMSFTATYDVEGKLQNEVYPNGMCSNYTYNQVGEATRVEYIKTTNCAEEKPTVWYYDERTPSIRGEMMSQTSSLAAETYGHDQAGRLTEVMETPAGEGCTTRLYAYDEASDRISSATAKPNTEGLCTPEGATVLAHNYDEAGRLADEGITYDPLGDITSLPEADAEKHTLISSFYVTGAVAAQEQNGVKHEYELDPLGRVLQTTTGTARTINHYDGPGETPTWTCTAATGTENCEAGKWTRNIPGIDGTLAAVQNSGSTPVLQLHDLQGNIVATAALSSTETKLLTTYNSIEFGVPNKEKEPPQFAWSGAADVSKSLSSGVITYGATSYVPQTGTTLQSEAVEPVGEGGSGVGTPYSFAESGEGMKGALRAGQEAPGLEAARANEAAERAIQAAMAAAGEGEDPTYYLTASRAEQVGKVMVHLTTLGEAADFLASIPEGLIKLVEGALTEHWDGVAKAMDWFKDAGNDLLKCAKESFTCKFAYDQFGLKFTLPSFDFESFKVVWEKYEWNFVNVLKAAIVEPCIGTAIHPKACYKL